MPNKPDVIIDPAADLAHIAYTGGTTGRSKGVMITHYNAVANIIQYSCWPNGLLPVQRDDSLILEPVDPNISGGIDEYPVRPGTGSCINITPWFHAMGIIGYLNNFILLGMKTILHSRFKPDEYLDDVERHRVTMIGGAAPMYTALLNVPDINKRNLTSVRQIRSGAAPIAQEILRRLAEVFPNAAITEGYGLTEVTMGATSNPSNRSGLRKIGSVGIPVFDTDIQIVSTEDGWPVAIGETGEICVKGPQVMSGYYKKPDETRAVLRDGWLHTGDIGRMDEDGYLYIVDRKKDMLIYKGYNVYPRELEEILFQHPAVANATVIGVPEPAVGEIPVAYVILRQGATTTAEELTNFVNQQVIPYKKIRKLYFVNEIPISAAGKVLKRVLREQAIQQQKDLG
jgi:long-chain acyl-CoA synthetase